LFGAEYQTITFDASATEIQNRQVKYSSVPGPGPSTSLRYFSSQMYQVNYPGSFWENYAYRLILNYRPFHEEKNGNNIINGLVSFLIKLMAETLTPHPFKKINRHYHAASYRLYSGVLRTDSLIVTNKYAGGVDTWAATSYSYDYLAVIPRSVSNLYSDGNETRTDNMFITDTQLPELAHFSQAAVDFLKDTVRYRPPVGSKTWLGQSLTGMSLTALDRDANGIIIPLSNWTARNGGVHLAGLFRDWNQDGKPTSYALAKHGAQTSSDTTYFFAPILLHWDQNLRLRNR
jgi:hypothetical protein